MMFEVIHIVYPPMREQLESAISALTDLLGSGESLPESCYQSFFEDNPIVFRALGYAEAFPKVRLPLSESEDGEYLEPDFLLKRVDGLFEILDLKLPEEPILKLKKNRDGFYAKINEYISQVSGYSGYFDDAAHRRVVLDSHGLDVQKRPKPSILVGRNHELDRELDKKQLHTITDRMRVEIITYDDILASLYAYHATSFGHLENLKGVSFHAAVQLSPKKNVQVAQYFFDCGAELIRNRFSILVDENRHLCFELFDEEGEHHVLRADLENSELCYRNLVYLCCEFGSSDEFSTMHIMIDNSIVARREFRPPIPLPNTFDFRRMILGMDLTHTFSIPHFIIEMSISQHVLSFQERLTLIEAYYAKLNPNRVMDG